MLVTPENVNSGVTSFVLSSEIDKPVSLSSFKSTPVGASGSSRSTVIETVLLVSDTFPAESIATIAIL